MCKCWIPYHDCVFPERYGQIGFSVFCALRIFQLLEVVVSFHHIFASKTMTQPGVLFTVGDVAAWLIFCIP